MSTIGGSVTQNTRLVPLRGTGRRRSPLDLVVPVNARLAPEIAHGLQDAGAKVLGVEPDLLHPTTVGVEAPPGAPQILVLGPDTRRVGADRSRGRRQTGDGGRGSRGR
jgi:hypothetical protein